MTEKSVLVVEDDTVLSKAIHGALTRVGCKVRVADTCSEGMESALEQTPELLVLDIGLPDGTGLNLLSAIRQANTDKCIPVVVVSSERLTRAQLKEHGIERFIPKPFQMSYLVEAVLELLPPPDPCIYIS
jgi:DNA-binding response OmpR family regulator